MLLRSSVGIWRIISGRMAFLIFLGTVRVVMTSPVGSLIVIVNPFAKANGRRANINTVGDDERVTPSPHSSVTVLPFDLLPEPLSAASISLTLIVVSPVRLNIASVNSILPTVQLPVRGIESTPKSPWKVNTVPLPPFEAAIG